MKVRVTLLITLSIWMLSSAIGRSHVAYAQSSHAYVGEKKCASCHDSHEQLQDIVGPDGNPGANPADVWKADKHSQAFDNLTGSERATKAAGVAQIAATDTQTSSKCLSCHATGASSDSPPSSDQGVSCEACHGPGADYRPQDKHGAITDAASMQAAVALGLIDMRDPAAREKNCRGCHLVNAKDRPCYISTEPPFDMHNDKKFQHWRNNVPVL